MGESVATWLAALNPFAIYDQLIVHGLRDVGIRYDSTTHLLAHNGVLVELPTHTPAQLIALGAKWVSEDAELMVIGHEIARALHYLLWPLETPPSRELTDPGEQFDADMLSISQSEHTGRPMWRPELTRR